MGAPLTFFSILTVDTAIISVAFSETIFRSPVALSIVESVPSKDNVRSPSVPTFRSTLSSTVTVSAKLAVPAALTAVNVDKPDTPRLVSTLTSEIDLTSPSAV